MADAEIRVRPKDRGPEAGAPPVEEARAPLAGEPDAPHGEPGAPLIEIAGLRFGYPPHFTLEIERFTLRAGARIALVGRNGAGKTTWLRLLAGLERPASCTRFERRGDPRLGFVRQNPYLFAGTVSDNLAYPLRLRRLPRPAIDARVGAMLERMELKPLAARRADELSGGERKRLALGRALIGEPELLLLDEPDAHLDRGSRQVIETVLRDLPATVLFTTHDLRFAYRLAGEVLHLRDGRVAPGTPENVLTGRVLTSAGEPGISRIETAGGLTITVARPLVPGPARLAIDPRHLVISREPLDSSMLNRFTGRIASTHEEDGGIWLEIALAGERLTAIISRSSYERLGLNLGQPVVVSWKANAVELLWPADTEQRGERKSV